MSEQHVELNYKGIPIKDIVIYKHPIIYLTLVVKLSFDLLIQLKDFIVKRFLILTLIAILWLLVAFVDSLQTVKIFFLFAAYWIILGVASSIGLGTGLHTFVLYLGPHIAKVAIVATNCGHIPTMLPNRWQFAHFGDCITPTQTIGFLGILLAVQLQSFLWGLGTAIGELPPYFVAKKAADSNQQYQKIKKQTLIKKAQNDPEMRRIIESTEQIQEIQKLRQKQHKTWEQKAKVFIYQNLQKYGFITILLCASIPNPLFDLAGITCGHFRIPFRKFFVATFIGKAIIKVHIQMLFVIAMFRKQTMAGILNILKRFSDGLATMVANSLEKQRQTLHHPSSFQENKPIFARLWDIFLMLMIGYFLLSIVTSGVREKAIKDKDKLN